MSKNVKLISKFLLPTLKESQISNNYASKSAELLERAGYIRKVTIQITTNFLKFSVLCVSHQREYTISFL